MVAQSKRDEYAEVFLRHGRVPLGRNPHAEPSLEEIVFSGAAISEDLSGVLSSDDVLSLGESYGDPMAGDPATFDFLRVTMNDGRKKEMEVFNVAIMMFMDNTNETRRVFRIINAIKGEQDGAGQPATRPESK